MDTGNMNQLHSQFSTFEHFDCSNDYDFNDYPPQPLPPSPVPPPVRPGPTSGVPLQPGRLPAVPPPCEPAPLVPPARLPQLPSHAANAGRDGTPQAETDWERWPLDDFEMGRWFIFVADVSFLFMPN